MGFEEPNYTQIPNDLFEAIPDLSSAELRVILVLCRETLGYHREETTMSIEAICEATGLVRNSTIDGIKKANEHGFIERIQAGRKTSTWKIMLNPSAGKKYIKSKRSKSEPSIIDPSKIDDINSQKLTINPSIIEGQLGLNKETKLNKEDEEERNPRPNCFRLYEQNIGTLTPILAEKLLQAEKDYPAEWLAWAFDVAVTQNKRNWAYVEACLVNRKAGNEKPVKAGKNGNGHKPAAETVDPLFVAGMKSMEDFMRILEDVPTPAAD